MTFSEIKGSMAAAMSTFTGQRTNLMRIGKYTTGMHYSDAYAAMIIETITELNESETYYPLDKDGVRSLIYAFNRITSSSVPDVWTVTP